MSRTGGGVATRFWRPATLAGLGALLVGVGLGRFFFPVTIEGEGLTVLDRATATTQAVVMPDVAGLPQNVAQAVLAEAGISADRVSFGDQAWAGPPGQVARQQPAAGAADPEKVVITLSTPARMPDVVGVGLAEARTAVEALGGEVVTEEVVTGTAQPGSVVSSEPPAGDVMGLLTVRLGVASRGVGLLLSDLRPTERDGCSASDRVAVGGREVVGNIVCSTRSDNASTSYSVAGLAVNIQGELALADDSQPGTASVRILADGREVASTNIGSGASVPVDAFLGGAATVTLEVTTTSGEPTVVFVGVRVTGTKANIERLDSES